MKTMIELRRHSIKDGDARGRTIGERGRAFARLVGEKQLRGQRFTKFFVSPMERTRQTLEAFAEGAGDFGENCAKAQVAPIYLFWEELKPMWKACHLEERMGGDMVDAAWAHDGGVVAKRALPEYLKLLDAFARTLQPDDRALVIGHSPHIEFLVRAISGVHVPGLPECDGYRLNYENGKFTVWARPFSPSLGGLREEFDRRG